MNFRLLSSPGLYAVYAVVRPDLPAPNFRVLASPGLYAVYAVVRSYLPALTFLNRSSPGSHPVCAVVRSYLYAVRAVVPSHLPVFLFVLSLLSTPGLRVVRTAYCELKYLRV